MFCSKCGEKIEDGGKFCQNCGTPVEEVVEEVKGIDTGMTIDDKKVIIKTSNEDGKATASLVLGIVSFIVPCINLITAIIGLILGIICKEKSGKRTAGIVLNSIALALMVIIFIVGFIFGFTEEMKNENSSYDTTPGITDKYDDDTTTSGTEKNFTDKEEKKSTETVSQANAVEKAKSYLQFMAFSYDGLVEQLEFEKFSHEDAVYGVDHCGADWNEQAVKKAKSYLEFMSFSHDGLVEQLEFEGFTHEQAEYGVTQVGL